MFPCRCYYSGVYIERSVVMAAMTLNSLNFGAGKVVKFDSMGMKPLKVAPRTLTLKVEDEGRAKRSDEECEAAVVAGNVPEAPPVPPTPAAPTGTPVVTPLVSSCSLRCSMVDSVCVCMSVWGLCLYP